MEGLIHTGIVSRKVETDDSYGGVTGGTPVAVIAGWKCRLCEDYSNYAREMRGRGGRQSFHIVGAENSTSILHGDILTISSIDYEVMEVAHRNDVTGSHHWYLRVEKIAS